jgi:type IV fimbrial biogenesis protein FimT
VNVSFETASAPRFRSHVTDTGTASVKSEFRRFTMLELVIVMAIVAILATIAMPGFQYVTSSNRVSTEVNGLLGDMQYARNEALKEGQPITVCPSANPTSPTPSCSGSTAWQSGWIVFPDPDSTQTVGPTTSDLAQPDAVHG